ncbi:hypothetical protein AVEN_264458-1 [Araneus ventricosus]|uniref:SOCS box domain-containing protein n=1 Tax=Araneus ventricosus TaxID=182803 RepID=A0A4Y2UMT9_ARAVE|nr:hypothetical protein AVEN_210066-1 [Araneus ventricosus]GBO14362.1 hypothetical protein AVEN_264458-1 [Araneus ventricosus]
MYRRQSYSFHRGRYFTDRVQHQGITLHSLADYVRFSFIVQKSLTPLDLKLCERYFNTNNFTLTYHLSIAGGVSEHISTEEKCRKVLATDQSLLYRLHLDLPKGRECSLHGRPKFGDLVVDPSIPHIGSIFTPPDRLLLLLCDYIVKALRLTGKELRILEWLVRFDEYSEIPSKIRDILIEFLSSKKIHSPIVKGFFNKFNLREWMVENEEPEILEYLLYEARHKGIILEDGRNYGLTDCCIIRSVYLNIGPTLKYNYAATYSMDICAYYLGSITFFRVGTIGSVIRKAETWMSRKRFYKLLQFFKIYSSFTCSGCRASELADASEAVRLLWESVSDSFLSSNEIMTVLGEKLTAKELTDMCNFYSTAVGESHSFLDTRSLKHLCRTAIRAFLWAYKLWLPDGIRRTGLPEKLQSYLNLEKVLQKQSGS